MLRYCAMVVAYLALTTSLLLIFQRAGTGAVFAKILAQITGFILSFMLLDRSAYYLQGDRRFPTTIL
jgi:putative flippase GtrA